jgi:hypothetical protein
MSKNISELVSDLATKYAGAAQVEAPAETKPETTRAEPPAPQPAPSGWYVGPPRPTVKEEAWASLQAKRTCAVRPPYKLMASDLAELRTLPLTRDMDFDKFCQHACLPVLQKGLDPDYEEAAKIFLARKKEIHTMGKH